MGSLLMQTEGLSDEQREIVGLVREFVDEVVIPQAARFDAEDEYPTEIVAQLKEMGLFGLTIPSEYGGLGESLLTYSLVVEELTRGWMSLSGVINTHFIVSYLVMEHGTEQQRTDLLPRLATGELTGAFSMSEPGCGSDVSAITTRAVPAADGSWSITGQKMWLTNGATSSLVAVLVKTDTGQDSVYRNMSTFLVEKTPGFGEVVPGLSIPPKIKKMGYHGVDTTELVFDEYSIAAGTLLGGEPGRGFYQMMDGIEVGRVNVAARACGLGYRALELAMDYAQVRSTFGSPLTGHQAVQFRLAEMATSLEAAHQLTVSAARTKDAGGRADLSAGMAKYFASEACLRIVEDSMRIHGGYGYSKEYEIERLYRDAPMLMIGEGTADIQRMIIARRLVERAHEL